MNETEVGLDFGNTRIKVWMLNKGASIPSIIGIDKPVILKEGKEVAISAFSLLFRQGDNDTELWFGQDVLTSNSIIHKIDEGKYIPDHISILTRAVLYEWQRKHGTSLIDLGKLEITTSMPPGLYQQSKLRTKAENAYDKAFNRGQSHVKIRGYGKETIQIVTSFNKLIRETVVWGKQVPHKNKLILVADLGGGTNDLALFNGNDEPIDTITLKNGLLHTFAKIDPSNPNRAEWRVLQKKNNPPKEILAYYSMIEYIIRTAIRDRKQPVDSIYLIGGGAALMPKSIKSLMKAIASTVVIKDEFENARANYREALKNKEEIMNTLKQAVEER